MARFSPDSDFKASLRERMVCIGHPKIKRSNSPVEALLWHETIAKCPVRAQREHLRWLGRNDLFFLLVYLLNRTHFLRDERTVRWTFEFCKVVQDDPDGYVDLGPRESFKSEIITFGKTIQDIVRDPERTFGIFSHTRPLAADFVSVIKREFENNEKLKWVYSDILWANPKLDARAASVPWSDHEITVRRKSNRTVGTVEAWGLTDGQPTSRRFTDITYDDVSARSQISELMIQVTTRELQNSFLLTASDPPRYRYIGTFQEIGDTTQHVIDNGLLKLRRHEPLDAEGNVAFCSDEKFAELRSKLSTKIFALQILLDPSKAKAEYEKGFREEWWETYDEPPPRRMMNVYGLVDPAGDSPDSNSQFALWIVGVGADKRRRVLDLLIDKLDLEERWEVIFSRQQKWDCLKWAIEKYGFQSDIDHFKYRMKEVNNIFTIVPVGGIRQKKDSRIEGLIPSYKEHLWLFPRHLMTKLKDGREIDVIKYFKEREYLLWPYNPKQRDGLDAQARFDDPALGVVIPRGYGRSWTEDAGHGVSEMGAGGGSGSYMSE